MSKKKKERVSAPVVITAHVNADFDSLAAMIAASKLYDNAALVFPGSQEKNLRNFFIQSATYLFNFQNARDIDPDSVETLVVVDTRQRSRLGHVNAILERADKGEVKVHVWDHHPDSSEEGEDIKYDEGTVVPWGSATAILVDQIEKRGITLTEDEATMMALGIYEDTGAFTFASTTEHDFHAGAYLKSQGMDLNVVADILHRDLTAEQISILNDLLESAMTHEINGVPVVVAEVTIDEFVGDFALLAHKLMDMENVRVLFALGMMRDRVHVVARSRTPDVDVSVICKSLGGGGHEFAASATVKDRTLTQVKDELFALLYSHINPQRLARDLMNSPAVAVYEDDPIDTAVDIMTRYGFKALPVLTRDAESCAGILDHATADKAKAHGLGHVSVDAYMSRECQIINPESDLYPVMEIIVGGGQRLCPVVEDGRIIGVITRTDLINHLIEEPARIPETLLPERRTRERSIRSLMRERLPQDRLEILEEAGRLAESMSYQIYAVGGFVRDILLRRENLDVDLVVEGDGIAFARALARKLGGRVRAHKKFRTAVIVYTPPGEGENGKPLEEQKVDVATARLEYYEYPAALPTVELSSIKMDLFRRDFTVNALAVQLNPNDFGRLVDFFGAQRDIKERVIRVLHSLSFVEDPTRILRAIRFEQRFHFRIGKQTTRLIKNAIQLKLIDRLSGARLFNELKLMLREKDFLLDLLRMEEFDVLKAIYPAFAITQREETLLREIEKVLNWYALLYEPTAPRQWLLGLMGLTERFSDEDARGVATRLAMPPKDRREFLYLRKQCMAVLEQLNTWKYEDGSRSGLYFILEPLALEGILFIMARTRDEDLRKHISLHLTKLTHEELEITGEDLIAMGLEPGPHFSQILRAVLAAKLDGHAPTLLAELGYAERLVRQMRRGEAGALRNK
ncbi:polya polymerase [Oceanidesulfovibrio indonesiensis]|uniref:Polya polymerase n=1 Tax=Oceanidesulfovibrio indonesiensis TaxID=54767 RepID=A0A7M3MCI3_9BACT|nr:CBS domain-containing protein [Oceanidesulfovibrio indonesiensis]TVM15654.1 polya polymerase [Oceanidesulfovibrio indonesiensis]